MGNIGKDVTDELIKAPAGSRAKSNPVTMLTDAPEKQPDRRIVMVVHGRDEKLRKSMFDFLRSIGLEPKEWSAALYELGLGSPYIGQVLDRLFEVAQAVVVLMTPDDDARLNERLWGRNPSDEEKNYMGQPRANVLFEAGMAFGRMPERTILVEVGKIRRLSDIEGRHVVRLDNSADKRKDLAQRLEKAGCDVNTKGNDWLTVGSFHIASSRKSKHPQVGVLATELLQRAVDEHKTTQSERKSRPPADTLKQFSVLEQHASVITHWFVEDMDPDKRDEVEARLEHARSSIGTLRRYKDVVQALQAFVARAEQMYKERNPPDSGWIWAANKQELEEYCEKLYRAMDDIRSI